MDQVARIYKNHVLVGEKAKTNIYIFVAYMIISYFHMADVLAVLWEEYLDQSCSRMAQEDIILSAWVSSLCKWGSTLSLQLVFKNMLFCTMVFPVFVNLLALYCLCNLIYSPLISNSIQFITFKSSMKRHPVFSCSVA